MDKSKSIIYKKTRIKIAAINKILPLNERLPRVLLCFLASAHCEPKSIWLVVSLYFLNFESNSYILPSDFPL